MTHPAGRKGADPNGSNIRFEKQGTENFGVRRASAALDRRGAAFPCKLNQRHAIESLSETIISKHNIQGYNRTSHADPKRRSHAAPPKGRLKTLSALILSLSNLPHACGKLLVPFGADPSKPDRGSSCVFVPLTLSQFHVLTLSRIAPRDSLSLTKAPVFARWRGRCYLAVQRI